STSSQCKQRFKNKRMCVRSLIRVELEWDVPMAVTLPVEVQLDPAHQPFPFLDTTLADLGEPAQGAPTNRRVFSVCSGVRLRFVSSLCLQVRVKAQKPGDKQLQEVLYSTEAHTDRSFCRTGVDILPWKQRHTGEDGLKPVEMTMALDMENKQPGGTEAPGQRDI
uniref:Si:ch211-196f5.2 n=1 Tax=Salarias fasciatus TaxID=181472 RepID=A0A672IR98_SALFA